MRFRIGYIMAGSKIASRNQDGVVALDAVDR
jgi:hypothetical protein